MNTPEAHPLSIAQRRRARSLAYWNGAIWAVGNGLTSSWLVIYIALELGAPRLGLGIALIRAAPQLAGMLRLSAPALIGRLADRKRFCMGAYFLSAVTLLGLPATAVPGWFPSAGSALTLLVGLWCVYHLLEYLGSVALWSWMADLVPQRIRGSFLGRRERWMVSGQAVAMIAGGLFSYAWRWKFPEQDRLWIGYAIPAALGASFMMLAVLPLARMPGLSLKTARPARSAIGNILAPLADPLFLRFLAFGCWFSFFNGITQSAQDMYPRQVLGISLLTTSVLMTGMRCGQLTVSPWLGRLIDRFGSRPVMMASLAVVATGPLFYFLSAPDRWWWIVGTWTAWIAFAGLNIGLPNLLLKVSPQGANTPYIAMFYAVTGLCVATSTILGGMLYDHFGKQTLYLAAGLPPLDYFHAAFLASWFLRSLGVLVLLWVVKERIRHSVPLPL